MSGDVIPFISYAREDLLAVESLVSDLYWLGAKPWVDFEKLRAGQDWKREIRKALESCSHAIVVISANSVNKRGFFQREVRQALDLLLDFPPGEVFVVPVRLDNTAPLHDEIKGLQWIDIFDHKKDPLKELASGLGLIIPELQFMTVNTHYHLDDPIKDVATVCHVQTLRPFRSNINEMTIRGIAGSGDVMNVRSNLGSAALEREGGVICARIHFSSSLSIGEVITHTVTYEGNGCFRDSRETIAQNISHIMHSSGIHVNFPALRPPKTWETILVTEDGIKTIRDVTLSADNRTLSVMTEYPPLGSRIVLSWTW